MSKRKRQARADRLAAQVAADQQEATEVEALEGDETDESDEPDDETPPEGSPVGPLASVEEVDAAVESVLGSEAFGGDVPEEITEEAVTAGAITDEETIEVSMEAPFADDGPADSWEEPTRVGEAKELAELVSQSAVEHDSGALGGDALPVDSRARLESIVGSLLFASDRPLGLADLKRLVNERDGKKLTAAVEGLQARHQGTGIELASTAGGWQFRTSPENAVWVAKLVAGRPARLSRAMLETLAIVAYRQPITRPEIDEIRGVDCGPVLKTLLDRALIRMIGKKEEVGRPILYGTTPEFLRTFSLKDLNELPTLRQFHELGAAEQAKVDAEAPDASRETTVGGGAATSTSEAPRAMPAPSPLPDHDPDEEDALLSELDEASAAATRAATPTEPQTPTAPDEEPPTQARE